jgi:biopolymer transport protein ExbD
MKLRGRNSNAEIPTSSMADIAFLLIIFFMVTAVFATTKGLELVLPDERPGEVEPDPAIVIHVRPDEILIDCKPVEAGEILAYLEPRLLGNPDKPVVLYADSDAVYQRMVDVYDVLVSTHDESSPWPFRVDNIHVPTRGDVDAYVAAFGANPLESACR